MARQQRLSSLREERETYEVDDTPEPNLSVEEELLGGGFIAVPHGLMECSELSALAKIAYCLICSYERRFKSVFPGQKTLAQELGASRFAVSRAMNELVSVGLLEITRPNHTGTNHYEAKHLTRWLQARQQQEPDPCAETHLGRSESAHDQERIRTWAGANTLTNKRKVSKREINKRESISDDGQSSSERPPEQTKISPFDRLDEAQRARCLEICRRLPGLQGDATQEQHVADLVTDWGHVNLSGEATKCKSHFGNRRKKWGLTFFRWVTQGKYVLWEDGTTRPPAPDSPPPNVVSYRSRTQDSRPIDDRCDDERAADAMGWGPDAEANFVEMNGHPSPYAPYIKTRRAR